MAPRSSLGAPPVSKGACMANEVWNGQNQKLRTHTSEEQSFRIEGDVDESSNADTRDILKDWHASKPNLRMGCSELSVQFEKRSLSCTGRGSSEKVAICDLRFASCGLRLATCGLRLAVCGVRFCELRFGSCEFSLASCDLRVVICELRVASCEL